MSAKAEKDAEEDQERCEFCVWFFSGRFQYACHHEDGQRLNLEPHPSSYCKNYEEEK